MALDRALERYLAAARAEPFDSEVCGRSASALLEATAAAPPEVAARAISELAADIERDGESLVLSTVVAGALIERGVPGDDFERALFPRLLRWLSESVELLDELLANRMPAPSLESDDDVDENEWVGIRLSEERAWALVGDTHLAAIALLGANPAARGAERRLLPALRRLEPYHPGAAWLRQMLDVLDDEPIVVIDVAGRRGAAGTMSGVASNFELFVLIAHAATDIALPRPDDAAVSCLMGHGAQDSGIVVETAFNAYAYSGLGPDVTLPEPGDYGGSAHWIWGEGEPWEIPALDGTRVVLLGPPSYARLVPAQRTFASLRARLALEALSTERVDAWLARVVRANAN
jgi:hypothetical protein